MTAQTQSIRRNAVSLTIIHFVAFVKLRQK